MNSSDKELGSTYLLASDMAPTNPLLARYNTEELPTAVSHVNPVLVVSHCGMHISSLV